MTHDNTQKYRIVSPVEVQHEVVEDYHKRSQYGVQLGWQTTHNKITLVPKTFSLWYGWPGHGKTTIGLCVMAQIAKREKKRFLLYCREEGEPKDLTNLLASIWIGRQFYPGGDNRMNVAQLNSAIADLSQYFTIIDGRLDGFDQLIAVTAETEKQQSTKFWGVMADPLNTLVRGGERIAAMYEEGLMAIHDDAKQKGRHYMLFTHPGSDADKKEKTEQGITYQPPPTPYNLKGGRTLYDMGYLMVGVWRPPLGLSHNGIQYEKNEIQLIASKIKPRGSGETGTYKLYYDAERFNYFEIDGTTRRYANDDTAQSAPAPVQQPMRFEPNRGFDDQLPPADRITLPDPNDELPF